MKVACSWLYICCKYGFPPDKMEYIFKGIRDMHDLGFQYIELEGIREKNVIEVIESKKSLKSLIDELGLKFSNFAILLPDIFSLDSSKKSHALALFKDGVKTARYLETDFVWTDSFMPPVEIKEGVLYSESTQYGKEIKVKIPDGFNWEGFWINFVDSIKNCNRIAKDEGLPLLLEPRVGEVISNTDAALRLISEVNDENFGLILDTAHQHAQKEILPLSIEKLGKHLKYVHAADNDGRENRHLLPGRGTIDWEELFLALKRLKFDGYFSTDIEELPREKHKECKCFLEEMGKKYGI